jgi:hypothetical protein
MIINHPFNLSLAEIQYGLANANLTELEESSVRAVIAMERGTMQKFDESVGAKRFNATVGRAARKICQALGLSRDDVGKYWVHLLVNFDNDLGRDDLNHNIWTVHPHWIAALPKI